MTNLNDLYNKPFLTPKEVSLVLGVGIFTIYDLLKAGELKGIKLGHRTWRIKRENLDAYIASKEVKS